MRRRTIEAHLPRNRFDELALTKGQRVYVSPTNVRVFAEPARLPAHLGRSEPMTGGSSL